jgi:N-methylhydantoinase A/oxoprolinase/acetone carboxylase beta subunit
MVQQKSDSIDMSYYKQGFLESHQREFGFNFEQREVIIDNIRVRSVGTIRFDIDEKIQTEKD